MSSSFSRGAAKKGGEWTEKIYVHTDSESLEFQSDQLEKAKGIEGANEEIKIVEAYKSPLSGSARTDAPFYHLFILFETDNWWWSIEKNSMGIILQRNKRKENVRDRNPEQERGKGISFMDKDIGCKTISELIDWLSEANELNKKYNVLLSNCQDFGYSVFNFVAKSKKLRLI